MIDSSLTDGVLATLPSNATGNGQVADVESSILQATRSGASQSFNELSPDERRHLREWQRAASTIGVDAVEDLASRPWPSRVADTIIGVFRVGLDTAPWLVIGHNGAWAVACCTEGSVSRELHSLAEALAVIYPGSPQLRG